MFDQNLIRQQPLPSEMQILLDKYPRDAWNAHPNFKQATKNWLGAHRMFRTLSKTVSNDAEKFLDKRIDPQDYSARLSYRGNALIGNLHGHHGWEDYEYFPELSAADPRFDEGLQILEKDHLILDGVLHDLTDAAIRALELIRLDDDTASTEVDKVYEGAQMIEALLARHLVDEEELAVPIIIHHKLRG